MGPRVSSRPGWGDLRAHQLEKPFCTLVQAGYFLDLTFNQVQARWEAGALPRARARDGSLWMPSGKKLVPAAEIYPMLDAAGRDLFDLWQRGRIRTPQAASGEGKRDIPVRLLAPCALPDHGTTARYCRGCTCPSCRDANRAYQANRRASR